MTNVPKLICRFGEHVVTFPKSWNGVTFGQFMRLVSEEEWSIEHVLRCIASDETLIRRMPDPAAGSVIVNKLPYLRTKPDFEAMPVPTVLTIGGRAIPLPTSLGLESFGQKLDLDNALADLRHEGKEINPVNAAASLLGIYLCPGVTGKPYDTVHDVEAIMPAIEQLPVTDAIPLAGFFLRSYASLTSSGRVSYQDSPRAIPIGKRLAQWFASWLPSRNGNSSTPSVSS